MALKLLIGGQPVTEPVEWKDLQVKAAFGTNSNQPSIETDRLTLVLDAAQKVLEHVNGGKIFEELSSDMSFDGFNLLNGFIDTAEDLELLDVSFGQGNEQPNQLQAKFKKNEAIQYFTEKLQGVSFLLSCYFINCV